MWSCERVDILKRAHSTIGSPYATKCRMKKAALPPSRQDKVHIGAWVDPELRRRVKILSAKCDKTVDKLVGEALNDLLDKYDRKNPQDP